MPDGPSITPETESFIEIAGELSELYAGDLAMWTGSPFAWILTLPSRTKGAVGEKLVAEWLVRSGFRVSRSTQTGCDRVVNGVNVEIKFSTLWKSGGYTFQQLRDQDYKYLFFLGLSPSTVHAWFIPKHVAWSHSVSQHGGKEGTDTRWLSFPADAPSRWLEEFGGTLDQALAVMRKENL
jgi:hypothetical protein